MCGHERTKRDDQCFQPYPPPPPLPFFSMIRAIPTNSADRLYCKVLGQGAVHGAFAGYTDFTVGLVRTGRERERGEERARGDD